MHCGLQVFLLLTLYKISFCLSFITAPFHPYPPLLQLCPSNYLYSMTGWTRGFYPLLYFPVEKSPAAASGGASVSQGITRSRSFTGDTIMTFVSPKETLLCQRINYEKNWLLSCQQEKKGGATKWDCLLPTHSHPNQGENFKRTKEKG